MFFYCVSRKPKKKKICKSSKKLVDFAGRPIRFTTLNFTWKAPMRNVGRVQIRASVADGNFYQTITSNRIKFETFPVRLLFEFKFTQIDVQKKDFPRKHIFFLISKIHSYILLDQNI